MTSWQASVNWSKNILDERTTWLNARHILSQSQHFQPENRRSCLHCHISCLHCHISCLHCQEVVYIVMPALPPGAATLRGIEIPHGQQQSQVVLLAPHHDGIKQGRRCNHYTWSLDDSGPLSRGCSQQDLTSDLPWSILDTWPNQRNCDSLLVSWKLLDTAMLFMIYLQHSWHQVCEVTK